MIAKTIVLVLPLGLDTFAVCCAIGMTSISAGRRSRVSILMVSFEAGMPLVGLAIGAPLGRTLGVAADYIAIGVLLAFGAYTLIAEEDDERAIGLLDASGWKAVALGVSISLDELAVGFTLGLLKLPILTVIIAIAAQTLCVTQIGMRVGQRLGGHVHERVEQLAGLGLIALACILLTEQLTS